VPNVDLLRMTDLKIAMRVLRRRPAFAATALLMIALGISATTAIYSVANAVLFRPLPFSHPERVVHLYESDDPNARPDNRLVTRPGNYRDWKAENQVFERMGAYAQRTVTLTGAANSDAQLLFAHRVIDGYFETLGVAPLSGRTFMAAEYEEAGGAPVAVISHQLWQGAFGGDPHVLGRQFVLDNRPHQVIGVMPAGFFPTTFGNVDVWQPLYVAPAIRASRVDWVFLPIARLRPGVTIEQARAELDRIGKRVAHDYPVDGRHFTAATISADEVLTGPQRPLFYLLLSASALLLLIAGVNVTNLLLARSVDRERELAVQTALGASAWQIVRQAIAESMVLAAGGGVLGVLGAFVIVPIVVAMLPSGGRIPRLDTVRVDGWAATAGIALALLLGAIVGCIPAWITMRSLETRGLRPSARGAAGERRERFAHAALVVTEVALSLVLLLAAGLVLRSFARVRATDPGLRSADVLTFQLRAPSARYPDDAARAPLYRDLEGRLAALPGVSAVGLATQVPFDHGFNPWRFEKDGQTTAGAMALRQMAHIQRVTPGYFAALGMRLRTGRLLTDADGQGAPRVMVINDTMARRGWPGEDPVGRRATIDLTRVRITATIVGVVADTQLKGPLDDIVPEMFWSLAQDGDGTVNAFMQTSMPPTVLAAAARRAIAEADSTIPVVRVRSLARVLDESMWRPRVATVLFGAFASVAVMLAALGLYSVLAYSVGRRTREIGIRMALGDRPGHVMRRIALEGLVLVAIGLACGLGIGVVGAPALRALLTRDTLWDPLVIGGASALLAVVSLAATFGPARRAAGIDPALALRAD
jgi:putative ABC transport system permease protein